MRTAERVEELDYSGGCPVCDAGHVAHTVADGTTYLCTVHVEGAHR